MKDRPTPEAVALAKARPNYVQNVSEWGEWAAAMRPYYDQAEETTACAAIRILAAECNALEEERDKLLKAVERLVALDDLMNSEDYGERGTYSGAYYAYYKGESATWDAARQAIAAVKGDRT